MIRCAGSFLAILLSANSAFAACPGPERVDIYPTGDLLPENLLRIYAYYPRPMMVDQGLNHVRLLDEAGTPISDVFLVNRENLWSPNRQRLTMILDPGRVKTGLKAHDRLGRALVVGRTYTVEVPGAALDADGCPLGADTSHRFTVEPADTTPPDPARWTLNMPKSGSTQSLIVDLGSAHDHLSLAFRLRVLGPDGTALPGSIALGKNEASWQFTPRTPWVLARHEIAIEDSLEDLAGNRPGCLFDRPVVTVAEPWKIRLPFVPEH